MSNNLEANERTCPGGHSVDRPAPALRPEETLCRFCVGRAMRQLERLPGELHDFDVTLTRQSMIRIGGAGRRRAREVDVDTFDGELAVAEQRLPFDPVASDRRGQVLGMLLDWAWFVAERTGQRRDARRLGGLLRAEFGADEVTASSSLDHSPRCVHGMLLGTCATCLGLPDAPIMGPDFLDPQPVRPARPTARPAPTTPMRLLDRIGDRHVLAMTATLRSRAGRNWLRTDEQGPSCAQAIAWMHQLLRSTVDRYDRRWYAGECGQPALLAEVVEVLDGDGRPTGELTVEAREGICTADLYAEPGKAVVVCDGYREPEGIGGCGAMHPTVARHRYVLRTLRERALPLDAILSVTKQLVGREVELGTVRLWRHRGKLRPLVCLVKHEQPGRCRVCRGEIYDGGQVLDLVVDAEPRPGPKRRDRKRTRVDHADHPSVSARRAAIG